MNLPTPSPEKVQEFKQIYLEEFGKELTDAEAWEAATITLQLFYLGTYGLKREAPNDTSRRSDATPDAQEKK